MNKSMSVVLSSGGLRSLVAAGIAAREGRIVLLHLKDGRAPAAQAQAAFEKQAGHLKPIKALVVEAAFLRQMSLPVETAGVISSTSSDAHGGLIPFRELHLLSVAAGFARQLRAGSVVWGEQIDSKNTDALARAIETVQVFNSLLEVTGGEPAVVVRTPLLGLEDAQVIELAYQMGLPLNASWSCQMQGEHPCMSCPACTRRVRAFRAAQLVDPLVNRK